MIENVVTDFEKQIYNAYLSALGAANNRPFRPRKDFDNLKDNVYCELKKLSAFFNKHRDINLQDFFNAPFKVHTDDKYQPIEFYNTYKATQTYTQFQKQKDVAPDSLYEYTKGGLAFVYAFCEENKIPLSSYKTMSNEANIPIPLLHLKQHKINFYTLHTLEIRSELYKLDREWREFYVRDFDELFKKTYASFCYAQDQKNKLKKITQAIERKLKQYEQNNI